MAKIRRDGAVEDATVVISGEAKVPGATRIREALLEALRTGPGLQVVLENISTADVSLLQLLCAAHRSAAQGKKHMVIRGADREPVATLLRQAGFLRHIGCHDSTRRTCLWVDVLPEQGGSGR